MKNKIKLIVTIVLAIIILFSAVSYAYTQSDADEVKAQISETEKELKEVEANLSQAMKDLKVLDGDISEVEYTLKKLQSDLKTLLKDISELEKKLQQAEADYDKRYESACNRIVAQHKYGNISYLDVLLNSSSLSELLSNYYLVEQIIEIDQNFLDELEKEKEQIEQDRKELEEKKIKVEAEKKQVEKQKNTLANKKAEKQKIVASLNEADAALQQEKEDYYAELNRIEEDLRRKAEQASGSTGGNYSGGSIGFPCPGYTRVSSYFGSRGAPLAGGSTYHKGIDLAATQGTSILASEAGTVIAVSNTCTHNYGKRKSCGCGGGFGNYLMVNHGGGLVTVYAHCTSIKVSLGSTVSRGQVIATVGSTGASSGHHLHFGVLKNGTYVDPAPYIGL